MIKKRVDNAFIVQHNLLKSKTFDYCLMTSLNLKPDLLKCINFIYLIRSILKNGNVRIPHHSFLEFFFFHTKRISLFNVQ